MTAEHGGARGAEGAGEYGGMDALMAAITGEPLPDEARRDPAFLAEHRAAEADVRVLREQLDLLAQALTGQTAQAPAATADDLGQETPTPGIRGRSTRTHASPARPARPARPGRTSGRRRVSRIALGSVAGAAALALAVGFGWVVTHSAASDDSSSSPEAAGRSVAQPPAKVSGDAGKPSDPELDLACSRLVVEGTVAEVEPGKASPWSRITLKVIRSYKPAHGPAEVGFLLDGGAKPAPRVGQHVLVRVGLGRRYASTWAVGDTRVAVNRAWITEALPGSRHTACPSDESS